MNKRDREFNEGWENIPETTRMVRKIQIFYFNFLFLDFFDKSIVHKSVKKLDTSYIYIPFEIVFG